MAIRIVGAGLGRTGTLSLKLALERLLGGTCHHMAEVFAHPEEVPAWTDAVHGRPVDWHALLEPYCAIVDYPGAAVWRDLADAFPDAPVLLSTRSSARAWYDSARATILARHREPSDDVGRSIREMTDAMFERSIGPDRTDPDAVMAAYEHHNAAVRAAIGADRLVEYQPGDGWSPLCDALGLPVPDEPFPHTNTREEFRKMAGIESSDPAAGDEPAAGLSPLTPAQRWAVEAHEIVETRGPDGLAHLLADDFVQESHRGGLLETGGAGMLGTVQSMREMGLHVSGTTVAVAGDHSVLTRRTYHHPSADVELLAISLWDEHGKLHRLIEFDARDLDRALVVLGEVTGLPVVRQ
jgi:hypothetical protein